MKQNRIWIFISASILIGILISKDVRPSPPAPSPTHAAILQSRQILIDFSATIRPYLSGILPVPIDHRLFQLATQLPDGIELTGQQLQINKIFSSLFPPSSRLSTFRGTMNFTLSLRHPGENSSLLALSIIFHDLKSSNPFPFSIKRADLHGQFFLNPRSHTATGTLTTDLNRVSFTLPAPLSSGQMTIQKMTIRGNLQNQRYTLTAHVKKIRSQQIQWKNQTINEIGAQTLTITPQDLSIKNLKATYKSQPFLLSDIHFIFFPLKIMMAGTLPFHVPRLPIPLPLPLRRIRGKTTFNLRGNLQPSDPTLVTTIRIDPLHVYVGKTPLPPIHFHARGVYKNAHLTLSPITLALGSDLFFEGDLHLPSLSRPLKNSQGKLRIKIPHLRTISHLLGKIFPKTLSDLQTTGNLNLASRFHVIHSYLTAVGKLSLSGTFQNIVLPITLGQAKLNLPFVLGVPRRAGSISKTKSPIPPPAGPPGSLKISRLEFGPLRFRNLTGRIYIQNDTLRIADITSSLYRGKMKGRGYFDFLSSFAWHLNLHFDHISLHEICHRIPGMEDALSGKVVAHLTLSGNGGKLKTMHGTFNAKTMEAPDEPMRISQAFMRKLTGKKGRFLFYGSYRPYSKGRMKAEIRHGIVTFKTLELSHSLFGFHDLSVSVSPLSNRIGLNDLIWEILQVPGTNTQAPVIKTK